MTWLEFCNGLAQILEPLAWCILFGGVVWAFHQRNKQVAHMENTAMEHELGMLTEGEEFVIFDEEDDDDDMGEQSGKEED